MFESLVYWSIVVAKKAKKLKRKTHKGLAKRIRITATGKLKRGKAGKRHLLSSKSRKRKRNLRRSVIVERVDAGRMKRS